jgi:hypothetical protein
VLASIAAASLASACVTSCDAGKQHKQQTVGPAIRVLGVNVGPDQPLPADGVIQIAFDRYLLPSTANRQSLGLVDGAHMPLPPELAPVVVYDPVARTVTLYPPKQPWLTEGQPYTLVLGIPDGNADQGGIRAIDRATLFADQKREFAFIVGPKTGAVVEPNVSFCRDVLPIFTAKCNVPTCHGNGDVAAASLVLDTSAGVGATAINRIAQGSNTGGRSSGAPSGARLFGVDMPIIDPGNPGNSWLMYKIDLGRQPTLTDPAPNIGCTNGLLETPTKFTFSPLVPQAQRTADEIERAILSDFILGREMPFPLASPGGYGDVPLTFDEREKVRIWIKNLVPGGALPECGGCGLVPERDAGRADAAATDASTTDAAGASDAADAGDASDATDQ